MRKIEDEDENFETGENGKRILKDGHTYYVNARMCDAMSRDVAKSAAKHASRQHLVDGSGNAGLSLSKPGYRHLTGGSAKTQSAWDAMNRATEQAYALDGYRKANAWKGRDWAPEENGDDDDLLEARKEGIRSELSRAGGDDDDIEEYLNNCDDDEILHSNSDEHRAAFVAKQNGRDSNTKAVDKAYSDYSLEIQNAWRRG